MVCRTACGTSSPGFFPLHRGEVMPTTSWNINGKGPKHTTTKKKTHFFNLFPIFCRAIFSESVASAYPKSSVPYLWLTISFAAHSLFCVSIDLEKYHVSLTETVYLRVKSPLCGTRLFIENMQWHQVDLNFPPCLVDWNNAGQTSERAWHPKSNGLQWWSFRMIRGRKL